MVSVLVFLTVAGMVLVSRGFTGLWVHPDVSVSCSGLQGLCPPLLCCAFVFCGDSACFLEHSESGLGISLNGPVLMQQSHSLATSSAYTS